MPKITKVELLARARSIQPRARSVVLSAFTDPRDLLAAINNGHIDPRPQLIPTADGWLL